MVTSDYFFLNKGIKSCLRDTRSCQQADSCGARLAHGLQPMCLPRAQASYGPSPPCTKRSTGRILNAAYHFQLTRVSECILCNPNVFQNIRNWQTIKVPCGVRMYIHTHTNTHLPHTLSRTWHHGINQNNDSHTCVEVSSTSIMGGPDDMTSALVRTPINTYIFRIMNIHTYMCTFMYVYIYIYIFIIYIYM